MTITADLLKSAAAAFADVAVDETPKIVIDLIKVTAAVSKAMGDLSEADDPEDAVEVLTKRLESLKALLEKSVEAEDGTVTVEAETDEIAKTASEFVIEEATSTTGEGGNTTTSKGDDETDEDDPTAWPEDMAPKDPPILKSARMTKGERPVPARAGARGTVTKRYVKSRDKAFGRDDSERCMT